MKSWQVIMFLVIGLLLGYFLTTTFISKPVILKSDTTITKLDTTIFEVEPVKYIDTGRIVRKDSLVHDTLTSKNDSLAVWRSHFAKTELKRVILNNDSIFLELKDSITQNKIFSTTGKYLWKLPMVTIANNVVANKNELYVIGSFGGNTQAFIIDVGILFKTKKNALYGLKLSYLPMLSKPMISISYGFKIF